MAKPVKNTTASRKPKPSKSEDSPLTKEINFLRNRLDTCSKADFHAIQATGLKRIHSLAAANVATG